MKFREINIKSIRLLLSMSTLSIVNYFKNYLFFGFKNGYILIYSLKDFKFLKEIQFFKESIEKFYFFKKINIIILIKYENEIIKIEENEYKIFDKELSLFVPFNKSIKYGESKFNLNFTNLFHLNDDIIFIDNFGSILFKNEIFKLSNYPIYKIIPIMNSNEQLNLKKELSFKNWISFDGNHNSFNLIDFKGNKYNFTSEKRIKRINFDGNDDVDDSMILDFIKIGNNSFGLYFNCLRIDELNIKNEIEKKLISNFNGMVFHNETCTSITDEEVWSEYEKYFCIFAPPL